MGTYVNGNPPSVAISVFTDKVIQGDPGTLLLTPLSIVLSSNTLLVHKHICEDTNRSRNFDNVYDAAWIENTVMR